MNKYFKKVLDKEEAGRNERMKARMAELEMKREDTMQKREEGVASQNKNTSKRKLESQNKIRDEERRAAEKAAAEAVSQKKEDGTTSRVGKRNFARGRAFDPNRYGDEGEVSNIDNIGDVGEEAEESGNIPETDTITDDE